MKKNPPRAKPKKPPKERGGVAITDSMVARARTKPPKAGKTIHPFVLANHPKSVFPSGAGTTMAQDDAISASLSWAAAQLSSAVQEGLAFPGYPDLAAMALRPEYRVVSACIATEMTRKWIRLQASGKDKTDKIAKLEAAMKKLDVQGAFRKAIEQDGFYGRSHLYIDTGATEDRPELMKPIGDGTDKISKAKVGKGSLQALRPIEAVWCYPADYNSNDPLRSDWYKPTSWFVQGKQMHASRLLTFVGHEVSDLFKPAYSFGGLSRSQMMRPYVDNWLRTRQSVSDLIHSFSVFVLKTNLASLISAGAEEVIKRADYFNGMRDNRGLMIVDKDTEDFANISARVADLSTIQAQSQEHMAAIARIPLVKLLGISPAGLNATAEPEIRCFYDFIKAEQEAMLTANLNTVIALVQLSEFGVVDPDIGFEFESLWSLDEKAEAEVRKTDAETDGVHIENGVISAEEARKRVAGDPDTPYAGLDPEAMPEPPEEDDPGEMLGKLKDSVAANDPDNELRQAAE